MSSKKKDRHKSGTTAKIEEKDIDDDYKIIAKLSQYHRSASTTSKTADENQQTSNECRNNIAKANSLNYLVEESASKPKGKRRGKLQRQSTEVNIMFH